MTNTPTTASRVSLSPIMAYEIFVVYELVRLVNLFGVDASRLIDGPQYLEYREGDPGYY